MWWEHEQLTAMRDQLNGAVEVIYDSKLSHWWYVMGRGQLQLEHDCMLPATVEGIHRECIKAG